MKKIEKKQSEWFNQLDFEDLEKIFKFKLFGLSEEETEEQLELIRKYFISLSSIEKELLMDNYYESNGFEYDEKKQKWMTIKTWNEAPYGN